jgi:hypothetical protein
MVSDVLTNGFRQLEQLGVLDVLLPFVLVFAVVHGVLMNIKVFKDQKINTLIALSLGLIVVFNHYLKVNTQYDIVPIINQAFPNIGLTLVIIVATFLILGILGKIPKGDTKEKKGVLGPVVIASALVVAYIYFSAMGVDFRRYTYLLHSDWVLALIALGVFFLIIRYVTGSGEAEAVASAREAYDNAKDDAAKKSTLTALKAAIQAENAKKLDKSIARTYE